MLSLHSAFAAVCSYANMHFAATSWLLSLQKQKVILQWQIMAATNLPLGLRHTFCSWPCFIYFFVLFLKCNVVQYRFSVQPTTPTTYSLQRMHNRSSSQKRDESLKQTCLNYPSITYFLQQRNVQRGLMRLPSLQCCPSHWAARHATPVSCHPWHHMQQLVPGGTCTAIIHSKYQEKNSLVSNNDWHCPWNSYRGNSS